MLDRAAWALLALLHLTPALALLRPALIASLYGVAPGSTAFPLLQHRAALFTALVIMCLWALFDPQARCIASIVCAISMLSFLALYWLANFPPQLRTIAVADLLFLPVLAFAGWRAFSS